MKSEIRKVTIERAVFIADDGKEFIDGYDCEKYEMQLKERDLELYDEYLKRCEFESCMYARLDTVERVHDLRALCKWNGVTMDGLNDVGIYVYVEGRRDHWINILPAIKAFMEGENNAAV